MLNSISRKGSHLDFDFDRKKNSTASFGNYLKYDGNEGDDKFRPSVNERNIYDFQNYDFKPKSKQNSFREQNAKKNSKDISELNWDGSFKNDSIRNEKDKKANIKDNFNVNISYFYNTNILI